MQTFLPYFSFDFVESAKCLDNKRLGKQRVEAWQIYTTLTKGSRWKNHPAVLMWKGYEAALLVYGIAVCEEWISRGFKDTMLSRFKFHLKFYKKIVYPDWLGDEKFHASHRSNLLRKSQDHYGKFGWKEPNDLPYYWPVTKDGNV